MKLHLILLIIGMAFLSSCVQGKSQEVSSSKTGEERIFLIQDFEQETFKGGVWEEFMKDEYVTFVASRSDLVKFGEQGYSLALDYDFRSDRDLVGGIWLSVSDYDFSGYEYFGFWVKGEPAVGYSRIIGVTFEDGVGRTDTRMSSKVGDDWHKIEISLQELKIENLSDIVEINVFIDKRYIDQKGGRSYFDNFYLR